MKSDLKRLLFSNPFIFILSGALTALPFIFEKLWIIAWFSISPMIYRLYRSGESISKRKAYSLGLCFGMGYFGVMYHWFAYLYPMEFAGLNEASSIAVIAVCWLGLAAIQSFEMGFLTLAYRILRPSRGKLYMRAVTFVVLWTTYEWQQTLGWRGVPWGRLALSQSAVLPMLQSASLFGSMFVSALIVAVNACIACAIYSAKEARSAVPENGQADLNDTVDDKSKPTFAECVKARLISVRSSSGNAGVRVFSAVAAGIFIFNVAFGLIRIAVYDEADGTPITAAVIQGNISSTEKWGNDSLNISFEKYASLTRECVQTTGAQLVVWPETVIPIALNNSYNLKKTFEALASELNIVLALGTFDDIYNTSTKRVDSYNTLIFFLPDGTEAEARYYKQKLVPFGESLPMEWFVRTFLPILLELNIISEPLTAGNDSVVVKTELGELGSLICFDSIYQTVALKSVRNGAELILLATNDSWFSNSAAVYQHNHHAAVRAIETGRYVVRAANTGISSIITPEGEVLKEIEPLVSGYTASTVYVRNDRTLYSFIGDTFAYICAAATALMLSLRIREHVLIRLKSQNRP